MALEYSQLPDDPEELKQRLLKSATVIDALRAEVLRLRRWHYGRSSESVDLAVSPELPLTGGEAQQTPMPAPQTASGQPPKLLSVDRRVSPISGRRPARMLPPDLPRVIKVHAPAHCTCPDCGRQMSLQSPRWKHFREAWRQYDFWTGIVLSVRIPN